MACPRAWAGVGGGLAVGGWAGLQSESPAIGTVRAGAAWPVPDPVR